MRDFIFEIIVKQVGRRLIFLKIYFFTLDFYETIKTNKKHLGKKIFVKTLYLGKRQYMTTVIYLREVFFIFLLL